MASHPEIVAARAEVQQSLMAGVRLAKTNMWVHDVEAFARYSYQENVRSWRATSVPYVFHFGFDVFDSGSQEALVHEIRRICLKRKRTSRS